MERRDDDRKTRNSRPWRTPSPGTGDVPLDMFRRAAERKKTLPADVSLVVCTHNRGHFLPQTLAAIEAMRPSMPWELVLVDNGSTDATPRVLEDFARRASFRVVLVTETRPGLAHARNAGVRAASAPLLVFTDDDCYPARDYLDQYVRLFRDTDVGFAAGRILLHDQNDYPITIRTDDTPHLVAPGAFIEPGLVQGANMAFRRDVLEAIGGFDPALGPGGIFNFEDLDVSSRASLAGFPGGYFPGPVVRHHHRRQKQDEVDALKRSYARGRGAYFASLWLHRAPLRPVWRYLLQSWKWKPLREYLLELTAAAHFVAYTLWRRLRPQSPQRAPA